MWLITNRGFISAVAKDRAGKKSAPGPNGEISIRGRRRGDLEALFPGVPIIETPRGDYRYRVFVSRARLADLMVGEALDIDYTNFKDSIPVHDKALKTACMALWTELGRLQPGGPYGRWFPDPRQKPLGLKKPGSVSDEVKRLDDWFDDPVRRGRSVDPQESCDCCGMFFPAADLQHGFCPECRRDVAAATGTVFVEGDAPMVPCGGCDREFDEDDLLTYHLCEECEDRMLEVCEDDGPADMAGLFAARHPATAVAE